MTVTNVIARTMEGTHSASVGEDGVITYVQPFKVITDDPQDDESIVLAGFGVPRRGDVHPTNPIARVVTVDVDRVETSRRVWEGSVTYSTKPPPDQEDSDEENPLLREAKVSWTFNDHQIPATVGHFVDSSTGVEDDRTGITNAAGKPFDPPAMRHDARIVISISKNFFPVPDFVLQYTNAVNSDAFSVGGFFVDERQAMFRLKAISEKQVENEIAFFTATMELHLLFETWDLNLLNVGFEEIYDDSGTDKWRHITFNGEPVTEPHPLSAAGVALTKAQIEAGGVNVRTYRVYRELPFSVLNFPQ